MNRFVLLSLLLLTACTPPQPGQPDSPPREISGVVNGDMQLSGRVVLAGDMLVPVGSRLTIAAGTVVTVRPSAATKIDPEFLSSQTELLVRGSLQIDGTAAAPVLFDVEPVEAGDAQWAGILLDRASDTRLRHVRITSADSGVLLIATDAELEQLDIRDCRYGVIVQSGKPLVKQTTVADGEGGVFIWDAAEPRLENLDIHANAEEGLMISRDSHPQLVAVDVAGNDIGVVAPASLDLSGLRLQGNRLERQLLPAEVSR